jgi:hypothetical protein
MTYIELGVFPLVHLLYSFCHNNSLIVFLSWSYVCHMLVVYGTPSEWPLGQSLARLIPVPACVCSNCRDLCEEKPT